MTVQESGIIHKRIKELDELSNDFISKAYDVDQEKTIAFLKEARIGGYSIIGEFYRGGQGMNATFIMMGSRYECNIEHDGVQVRVHHFSR